MTSTTPSADASSQSAALAGLLLLTIAYLGFISLGLPDPVAGVAWPSVRETFGLPQSGFGLVFIALGCGYCTSGFFGGKLTQVLGLGNLLWISSALVALAMLGSGIAFAWWMFVACGAIWGLGSGGIDAGLNAYASRHFSSRHMNWLHACYSLGATAGPLVMTVMVVQLGSWRGGYLIVSGVLALMTVLFLFTQRRWNDPVGPESTAKPNVTMAETLRQPLVWLQVGLFFIYVGLEFSVGQWSYTLLTESRRVPHEMAGVLASGYYGAIGVGRVVAGVVAPRWGLVRLIRVAMVMILIGTMLLIVSSPVELGMVGLGVIGLGLAPVFPCVMAVSAKRFGHFATHAIGYQVSAGMLGAALMPGLAGLLIEALGLEALPKFSLLLAILLFAMHEFILAMAQRNAVHQ